MAQAVDLPPTAKHFIRCVFLAIPIVCAIQYQFMGSRVGEVYPAIVMPAFAGSGSYLDGDYHVKRLEVVFISCDSDEVFLTQRELLNQFPEGRHDRIAGSFFYPLSPTDIPNQGLLPLRGPTP